VWVDEAYIKKYMSLEGHRCVASRGELVRDLGIDKVKLQCGCTSTTLVYLQNDCAQGDKPPKLAQQLTDVVSISKVFL
jgi:hypothetical protein